MISIDFTFFIVILNFILLLIILKKLLYKPLINFLNKRQKQIKDDIENAQKSRDESTKILESQKKMLQEARKETRELRNEAIINAKIASEQIINEAHNQKESIIDEAQKMVKAEIKKAKRSIENEIGQFVISLTGKIIGKKLNKKDDIDLIDSLIKTEMKKSKVS
ncbi:MAG: F0F1 ATP synthase subunit B [Candidatus Cloacimonetes bacterium]|nr:F0F1 ATP synthase subunit B [Candidatus Cloacimonadota bacterium]